MIGDWYNEDNYLVLCERIKKNSLNVFPAGKPDKLATCYNKVLKIEPDEMTLLLDMEKSTGIPKEIITKG